jgi:hypothetical protein
MTDHADRLSSSRYEAAVDAWATYASLIRVKSASAIVRPARALAADALKAAVETQVREILQDELRKGDTSAR